MVAIAGRRCLQMLHQCRNSPTVDDYIHNFLCKQKLRRLFSYQVQEQEQEQEQNPRNWSKLKADRDVLRVPFLASSASTWVALLAAARSASFHEKVVLRILTCALTSQDNAWCASPDGATEISRSSSNSSSSFRFCPFLSGWPWSWRFWSSIKAKDWDLRSAQRWDIRYKKRARGYFGNMKINRLPLSLY